MCAGSSGELRTVAGSSSAQRAEDRRSISAQETAHGARTSSAQGAGSLQASYSGARRELRAGSSSAQRAEDGRSNSAVTSAQGAAHGARSSGAAARREKQRAGSVGSRCMTLMNLFLSRVFLLPGM